MTGECQCPDECGKPRRRYPKGWYCSRRCKSRAVGKFEQQCVICGDSFRRDTEMQTPICSSECRMNRNRCEVCGTGFKKKKATQRYCSAACYHESTRKYDRGCAECGMRLESYQSKHCSRECRYTAVKRRQQLKRTAQRCVKQSRNGLSRSEGADWRRLAKAMRSSLKSQRSQYKKRIAEPWVYRCTKAASALRRRPGPGRKSAGKARRPTSFESIAKEFISSQNREHGIWWTKVISTAGNLRMRSRRRQS